MTSRGTGRKGRPRDNSQPPTMFDPHAFMEAMEITSDATRIRLATFQLEGESQIWWDWVRASRDPETMT